MVINHSNPDFVKRTLLPAILILCVCQAGIAQKERSEPPPLKERIFFGGSFGLQLGTITDIELAPVAGFWMLPRLAVAAGPDYRFYKDPLGKTNIYGGKAYLEFVLIRDINTLIPIGLNMGIFLHFEDEMLSLDSEFWQIPSGSERYNVNTLLAGAGLSQPVGRRASVNMMLLWALNEGEYNVYSSPEFRVTFIF